MSGDASLPALLSAFKLVKTKRRCCKSRPRCKKCPVVCKRLEKEGLAVRQGSRHYLVELSVGKKALKAARAR
jgi:polyferredoxin